MNRKPGQGQMTCPGNRYSIRSICSATTPNGERSREEERHCARWFRHCSIRAEVVEGQSDAVDLAAHECEPNRRDVVCKIRELERPGQAIKGGDAVGLPERRKLARQYRSRRRQHIDAP